MKFTRIDSTWFSWNSQRTRTMIAGFNTPLYWLDDVYLVSGGANGTNNAGVSRTWQITTPLRRALNCHWFESGIVVITPANKPVRTVDFGNGNCDNEATVTINGHSWTITLQ